jgi:drug/metabolite transporter (DMT)-like permease
VNKSLSTEIGKVQIERSRDWLRATTDLTWQSFVPVAFVLCWASGFVGEPIRPIQVAGFAVAALGVVLVQSKRRG